MNFPSQDVATIRVAIEKLVSATEKLAQEMKNIRATLSHINANIANLKMRG